MGRLNKPAKEGYRYRSPSQTNAEDLTPNLLEDVAASQESDFGRIRRGVDSTATNPANRRRQQEAGGRATLRSLGRAGLLGAAAEAGQAIGREIDRRNPEVGEVAEKAIEGSGVGSLMRRRAVSPGRVEFSDEAEQKLVDRDVLRARAAADEIMQEQKSRGYAKGGSVGSASKRADGIAQRGKTRGKFI